MSVSGLRENRTGRSMGERRTTSYKMENRPKYGMRSRPGDGDRHGFIGGGASSALPDSIAEKRRKGHAGDYRWSIEFFNLTARTHDRGRFFVAGSA
ncbi:MAG: hypothetical protein KY393_07100 [Actinobacteria bacterium]|nr:hypothetical protein [Actinomycetota bacterium]